MLISGENIIWDKEEGSDTEDAPTSVIRFDSTTRCMLGGNEELAAA
jgi:hypothetical protein